MKEQNASTHHGSRKNLCSVANAHIVANISQESTYNPSSQKHLGQRTSNWKTALFSKHREAWPDRQQIHEQPPHQTLPHPPGVSLLELPIRKQQ
jgi:hypothetical protein